MARAYPQPPEHRRDNGDLHPAWLALAKAQGLPVHKRPKPHNPFGPLLRVR